MTADRVNLTFLGLSDDELVLLDGQCRPEVQKAVNGAAARIRTRQDLPGLRPALAGLVADAVTEATSTGVLIWVGGRISSCSLCGRSAGYHILRSGPRKGRKDVNRPLTMAGVELASRFVVMRNHVRLGGCGECVTTALPELKEALRGIPVQLPDRLWTEGEPRWTKQGRARCANCGWRGHQGQMGKMPTLMGRGTYPGRCPSCKAEEVLFGPKVFEPLPGYALTAPGRDDVVVP